MSAAVHSPLPGILTIESLLFPDLFGLGRGNATRRSPPSRKGFAAFDFPDVEFEKRAEGIKRRLASRFDLPRWHRATRIAP